MRILPNRQERAMMLQQVMAIKDEHFQSQIALVLGSSIAMINETMKSIVTDEYKDLLAKKLVLPMVQSIRPDINPLEPEPSMGSIMVLAIPDQYGPQWDAFEASKIYQRVQDFYTPAFLDGLVQVAQAEFYDPAGKREGLVAATYTDDPETQYVLVVRWPTQEEYDSAARYREYVRKVFDEMFLYIANIERGEEGVKPLLPRRAQRRVHKFGKRDPEYIDIRSYGYDAEVLLNGCMTNAINDRITTEEFWSAWIRYLQERPEDVTQLRGLKPATATDDTTTQPASEAANDE